MKETLENLASMRRRLQIINIGIAVILLLSVVMIFTGIRMPGLIMGIAGMIAYFGWSKWQSRKYSNEVSKANIIYGLCAPFEDPVYLGRKGITEVDLEKMAMLPVQPGRSNMLVFQGFEGKKEGAVCRGWETAFRYQKSEKRTDVAFLTGTLITWTFPVPVPEAPEWLALQKNLVHGPVMEAFLSKNGYCPVPAGDSSFEKDYLLAARNGSAIPEQMIARIAAFCGKVKQVGAVHASADNAAVFLDHRFYTDKTKIHDLPQENQLRQNPLPERDDLLALFLDL